MGARIALWGTFDVENYGDHLFPRVARHELGRRLPGAVVEPFAPYGWLHPTPLDNGRAASPLGPWSPARARQLAAAHHLVLVGGGELIHLNDPMLAAVYGTSRGELDRMAPSRFFVEGLGPELEADCPVVWHAVGVPWVPVWEAAGRLRRALAGRPYVTVRDRHSARRLVEAGVDRPVEIVPDSALLIERIMPARTLAARLDGLRAAGGYPGPAAPLVVQGCDLLLPHLQGVVAAVARWRAARAVPPEVVVLETGRCRGDGLFADALVRALGRERVWRLPPDTAVEDLAAAVVGAELFLGSSLHGAITAVGYGRPFVLLNLFGDAKLDGFGDLVDLEGRVVHHPDGIATAMEAALSEPVPAGLLPALQARIDIHFDRVAELAAERAEARPELGPVRSLDAYAVTDHLARLRGELEAAQARVALVEAELEALHRRAGAAERELSALQATKTFRLLAPARDLYGRLRWRRFSSTG